MQMIMKNRLISLSRNLFQIVILCERLLALACAVIFELREIKELLHIQKEQAGDARLLTAEEAAEKLNVSVRTLRKWEKEGVLVPVHIQSSRYYRESDIG